VPSTDVPVYIALTAFVVNMLVAVAGTLILRALNVPSGHDHTHISDYHAEAGDPGVKDLPLDEMAPGSTATGSP